MTTHHQRPRGPVTLQEWAATPDLIVRRGEVIELLAIQEDAFNRREAALLTRIKALEAQQVAQANRRAIRDMTTDR